MALSWWGCQPGTSLMPSVLNCCGGPGNGGKMGQLCLEIGLGGSQVCYASSIKDVTSQQVHWKHSCMIDRVFKGFEGVRLKEDVVSRELSGSPPSSRAVEKAMKEFRAAEECWPADPKCTHLLCSALSKKIEIETLEGVRGSLQIVGARVNELWCEDTSVFDRHEQQVLDVGKQSSHSLACRREVLMDGATSNSEANNCVAANISSTKIALGNWCSSDGTCNSLEVVSIKHIRICPVLHMQNHRLVRSVGQAKILAEDVTSSRDDNHYQDSHAVVSSVFSKDGFWAAVEMQETQAKQQATQKRQDQLDRPHLQNRYFNRCIHHLLAVSSLPRTTATNKEPVYYEPEQNVISKGGIEMDLEANEDDKYSNLMSGTTGCAGIYNQKRVMHLWDGYWAGPDYEDGWGFVEALVSPVDMDEPVCKTTE